MHIVNFEAFLIAITILTVTPGLDTAVIIRNSSRSGAKDGYITSLGICSGLFVHATFSAIGVSAILLQSAEAFQVMKWIGAAYLIWLGISGLKSTFRGNNKLNVEVTQQRQFDAKRSLREGFLSNVLNPKTAVFYLAFLPQFIDPNYSPFIQSLTMAGIHFVISMAWQCALAGTVGSATKLIKNSAFLNWMEGITGTVLIALGVKLILEEPPTT
ncbi:LysE family translocator [Vibrio sp. SCSIO 43137]|uniref:LysE family translocator n=1 Tax=Vibrio sp. SCSIO 43137 TaxID=3021011 RepID=UPI0023073181|nr:LysE family translocator [Vibrio sp. SCSIO 43137]WCE31177.1 LysE family translocator [Vibrio sp. SCSIO 43137]